MLTGAYGDQNGIVTNHWYDPSSRKRIYCVQDDSVRLYGRPAGAEDWNLRIEAEGVYLDNTLLQKHGVDPLVAARELARALPLLNEASPVDIAPTLSVVTGVELPAARVGRVLTEALK